MRKIERDMNRAIRNGANFSSSNTMVKQGWEGEADVYLHGNHIATVKNNSIFSPCHEITKKHSTTTKSARKRP